MLAIPLDSSQLAPIGTSAVVSLSPLTLLLIWHEAVHLSDCAVVAVTFQRQSQSARSFLAEFSFLVAATKLFSHPNLRHCSFKTTAFTTGTAFNRERPEYSL